MKKTEEWTKKDEETYEEVCIDDYDEEALSFRTPSSTPQR